VSSINAFSLRRTPFALLALFASLVLTGCPDPNKKGADEDGDGFFTEAEDVAQRDCDDTNPDINPGVTEDLCDGVDNDCSGLADDGLDTDGDDSFVFDAVLCEDGDDCDDTNAAVNPSAEEVCDGVDNDCNNEIDENGAGITVWADADGDGFGDGTDMGSCADTPDPGFVVAGGDVDCDDDDGDTFPGADELCDTIDNDCDTEVDEGLDTDADGDGDNTLDSCTPGTDCDDDDPNNFTGNPEVCDGADNDCSGLPDMDADGEVDVDGDLSRSCEDCDDDDATSFPGNPELCDGLDNDCDGAAGTDEVDGDADGSLACVDCDDADPNNFPGNPEACDGVDNDCDGSPELGTEDDDADGVTVCDGDCDDTNPGINPGAAEACDGVDTDCNGTADFPDELTDVDVDGSPLCDDCDDADGDNFPGNTEVCDGADNDCIGGADFPSEGADGDLDGSPNCADCDDADPNNSPDLVEVCDGADNDCSGSADFPDEDTDGDADGSLLCGDCDDGSAAVYPGAPELCDGQLNDCDGTLDPLEGDGDGDFYISCDPYVDIGVGGILGGGDCAAADGAINPGVTESCDGQDQDCDGVVDDGFDNDGDGVATCGPNGTQGDADDDCNDLDPENFPGASEICDGEDNDCDTLIDGGDPDFDPANTDNDGDGDAGPACGGADCNDLDPAVNSFDGDGDGVSPCGPDGLAATADDDCNDNDAAVTPSAQELCDGVDNDCDGDLDGDDASVLDDADGDGFVEETFCGGNDCDDNEAHVFPGLEYTSGFVRQCLPAAYPGTSTDWYFGQVDEPSYFLDEVSGLHYLYFRANFTGTGEAIGVLESTDGITWSNPGPTPVFGFDPLGWETAFFQSPSVVYAPNLAGVTTVDNPYLLFYQTRTSTGPARWETGMATAASPLGPFERVAPDGLTALTAPVLTNGVDPAELDSRIAGHLWVNYDDVTGMLSGWYNSRSVTTGEKQMLHATSDDGVAWSKFDTALAGAPDPILQVGAPGEWDEVNIRFPVVTPNSDPLAGPDEPLEYFYNGSNFAIGRAVGSATVVTKSPVNPVFELAPDAARFDGGRIRRPATFLDTATNAYLTYYGAWTVDNGPVWGPSEGNFTGFAAFIGRAVNFVPELTIGAPVDTAVVANPVTINGTVRDSAPELVLFSVVAVTPSGNVSLGAPTVTPGSPSNFDDQTVTWTLSGVTLPTDTTAILVEVEDEAGYIRSEVVSITVL